MRLYVLRHAIAEDGVGMPDSQRQLTDEGRLKLRKVLRQAQKAGVDPSFVLSSPYVRARQTAEIAVEELRHAGEVITSESFTPYANPHRAWEELREYRQASEVLVIGHNPHLSDLVCLLTGARSGGVEMKKAGLGCLEVVSAGPQPRGTLQWLITPKAIGV